MWDWTNKVACNIYYSRFIASYVKIMSKHGWKFRRRDFKEWLKSLGKLTDDQIIDICNMADNGKLELETHCDRWMTKIDTEAKERYCN